MSGMPYVFEQGTVLSVVDAYLGDPDRAAAALTALRRQPDGSLRPVVEGGGLDAAVLQAIPDPLDPSRTTTATEHIEHHWFGRDPGGQKVDPWWQGWTGDAEEITRWTLVSALEVSLGIDHTGPADPPAPAAVAPTRAWPIHVHWSCGAPLFQGWVGWHKHGDGPRDGVVNVVFSTPGVGEPMFATPHDPGHGGRVPDPYEDPARSIGDHGLWAVGQDQTRWLRNGTTDPSKGTPLGTGVLPQSYGLTLASVGPVVIVAPSEVTGGVLPSGRTYE